VNILKDILIVAHFTQVPGEVGNGRFNYIAEKIKKENVNVEVVTTSFSHKTKTQRDVTDKQMRSISYKLTMLYEPGYIKNVSLRRFYSHYIMGRSLKKYLENRKKPDIIYCSVPSLDVAKVTAKYAEENNIRFIIDIQDLWPEAFKMVFNMPIISEILFYPMKKQANYIYETADEIIAVSQTYVDRALKVNKKCKMGNSVYLGTDLNEFDNLAKYNKFMNKPNDEIWLAYIGTLGYSYDLISVIDALKIIKDKGINNIKFIVMGDGPLKSKFEEYAREKSIYVEFTGRLSYEKMVGILTVCDIAVNPIKKGSAGSIINKVGDYAAAGLPVINTQECSEYQELLIEYDAGFNCINGDPQDISEKILNLYNNSNQRMEMGLNNRKLARDLFNRELTYKTIIDLVN
jgi:glycosyltransferase involved in cell wall biosynthesis